jgi:hypothetical protein
MTQSLFMPVGSHPVGFVFVQKSVVLHGKPLLMLLLLLLPLMMMTQW